MCGILGIWQFKGMSWEKERLSMEGALQRIKHRGPDAQGLWNDPKNGLALGHARLSILDTRAAANQPMVSARTGCILVFNGEIYNFLQLREELESTGIQFLTRSDTEVLLAGYETWGTNVLDRLVGMFAFALRDPRENCLFLARDRLGEKPLYYFHTPERFAFASELPALCMLGGPQQEIDRQAIGSYLQAQYIASPRTAYRNYFKLPPATAMMVFDNQTVRQWRYWDPVGIPAAQSGRFDQRDAVDQLHGLMKQSVAGQMLSDVPLGAFLSGGIDSSVVVATMAELSSRPVETFTIGFFDPAHDEAPHAAEVARHLGTHHHVEYMNESSLLEEVERLPARFGEPFGDSSALPTYMVSRAARRCVTVSLSGDGGDEVFGGYSTYTSLSRYLTAHRLLGPALKHVPTTLASKVPKLQRLTRTAHQPPMEVFKSLVSAFSLHEALALTGHAPSTPRFDEAWQRLGSNRPIRTARIADMTTYLPEDILVKVDRCAMAVSLESRAPLLDHRIIEFALGLPEPLVTGKRILKSLAWRQIPRHLLDRPKRGFSIPLDDWFRGRLRPLLQDTLRPNHLAAAGIEDAKSVETLIQAHLGGQNHSMKLWILLMLVLWNQH